MRSAVVMISHDRRFLETLSKSTLWVDRGRTRLLEKSFAHFEEWRDTLLEQEALDSFLPLCESRGIGIVIGGPYNSGILATGAREGAFYNYEPAPPEILRRVERIDEICRSHGVRMVDAAFRFPLCHPSVLSVIPGGQSPEEMETNIKAASAEVSPALWEDLKSNGLLRPDAPTG